MKKFIIVIIAIIILLSAAAVSSFLGEKTRTIYAMDTVMTLKIKGSEDVLDEIENMIYKYDALLSAHNPESEIFMLNKNGSLDVGDDTLEVIKQGIEYTILTDGGFDITLKPLSDLWNARKVPEQKEVDAALLTCGVQNIVIDGNRITLENNAQIDLGGIAKGYIADKAREILKNENVKYAVMDFGGNVYVYSSDKNMRVGIQKPFAPRGETACTVSVNDKMVISSGVYERYFEENGRIYHHIIDKRTGRPSESGVYSVTITGESGVMCDALSTAGVVLGEEFLEEFKKAHGGFEYIVIDDVGNVERSDEQ